ncbi:MAG: hypothetical protein PHG02_04915 [Oscillospiraceae bacterium]|nr:hypothetical protein [Oscillospiraceae bacterium]
MSAYKKKHRPNPLAILATLLVFLALAWYAMQVLTPKDEWGLPIHGTIYDEKQNTADILFLGPSHVFTSVNPAMFWDNYGIAANLVSDGNQSVFASYYYAVEFFKTQRPKLVVLDVYEINTQDEFFGSGNALNILATMPWSENKKEAINACLLPEMRASARNPLAYYHTSYASVTKEALLLTKNTADNFKGFHPRQEISPQETPPPWDDAALEYMMIKNTDYLTKLEDLCRQNGAQLLYVCTPYSIVAEDMGYLNHMAIYANEHSVPFINLNRMTDEIGLSYAFDAGDAGHLNLLGAEKVTYALMNYIVQNYSFTDHRADPAYSSYAASAAAIDSYSVQIKTILREDAEVSMQQAQDNLAQFERLATDAVIVAEQGQGTSDYEALLRAADDARITLDAVREEYNKILENYNRLCEQLG